MKTVQCNEALISTGLKDGGTYLFLSYQHHPTFYCVFEQTKYFEKNFLIASTSDKRTPHTDRRLSCNNKSKANSLMGKYTNAEDEVRPAAQPHNLKSNCKTGKCEY